MSLIRSFGQGLLPSEVVILDFESEAYCWFCNKKNLFLGGRVSLVACFYFKQKVQSIMSFYILTRKGNPLLYLFFIDFFVVELICLPKSTF